MTSNALATLRSELAAWKEAQKRDKDLAALIKSCHRLEEGRPQGGRREGLREPHSEPT